MYQYGYWDINVAIKDSKILSISFVNSPFSELEESAKAKKAQEIAVFATNHFAPLNKVQKVSVSFITRELLVFVFHYDEGPTYLFDKGSLVKAGIQQKPAEQVLKAKASYSVSQNTTTVVVNNLQLEGDLNKGLILIPSFTIRGKKLVAPEGVDLEFASYNDREIFADDRSISFLVDNQSVAAGEARMVSSGKTADGQVSEFLIHRITYEQFLKIISGREVELRLSTKQIKLTDEHLQLLRDMKECVDASECK